MSNMSSQRPRLKYGVVEAHADVAPSGMASPSSCDIAITVCEMLASESLNRFSYLSILRTSTELSLDTFVAILMYPVFEVKVREAEVGQVSEHLQGDSECLALGIGSKHEHELVDHALGAHDFAEGGESCFLKEMTMSLLPSFLRSKRTFERNTYSTSFMSHRM